MKTLGRNLLVGMMLAFMFLLAACARTSPSFSLEGQSQLFKQNSDGLNNKIDLLWVVDNSASMSPLQTNLMTNFQSFMQNFEQKGYDYQIAVTTTEAYKADSSLVVVAGEDPPIDPSLAQFRDGTSTTSFTGVYIITPLVTNLLNTFITNATQGDTGSPDERAFSSIKAALESPLNASYNFPRKGAFLAVVILSDEDDFSGDGRPEGSWFFGGTADHDYSASTLDTVQSYVDYLNQKTASTTNHLNYNVSAIAVLDSACQAAHVSESPQTIIGQRYIQMASLTNGVTGSICDSSYANSLNLIQENIAELSTQFYLQYTPQLSTLSVVVNGVTIPEDATNGWTYNATANSIVFHGTAVPVQGATIAINFTPTTAH